MTPEYWDLVPAIIGGVIGALAGGLPAWLLAKRQSDETLRRDRVQRLQVEKALAFRVSVKLLTIINSLLGLRNHVQQCMALLEVPGNSTMEPYQVLLPMIGFTDEGSVRLAADEMAVFAVAKESDFMMDMMLLAQRHASSLSTFLHYCERRDAFLSVAPKPDTFTGQLASAMVSHDQVEALKPHTIPLNDIASALAIGLEEDLKLARKVATNFGPVTTRYFKDSSVMALSFPSDDQLAKMVERPAFE